MVVRRAIVFCLFATLLSCAQQDGPVFESQPTITANPNPKAPLVAVVTFDVDRPVTTVIEITDGERDWVIDFDNSRNPEEGLVILGMRPDRIHSLRVLVADADGNVSASARSLKFTTPPLPSDRYAMPRFKVLTSEPERMEPGITIVSVRRSLLIRPQDRNPDQQSFVTGLGLLLGLDNEGEVVWYYQTDERISGIDRLRNGNIIYHLNSFETVEIDMLGNRVNSWYAEQRPQGKSYIAGAIPIKGLQTLHHQPHEIRAGTFLSFSANSRVIENWYTNEYDPTPRKDQNVMGDTIVEFDKRGNILWSWNAFDHLDVYQIGYEAFFPYWTTRGFPDTWDWTHGNGVSYDARDDSVIASFKLLDAIVKIDRESKEIKWIFGDHAGWGDRFQDKLLTPVGDDFRWPYHQHNPRWTHAGTLLVFNNNRGQTKPFDGQPQVPFEDTYSYSAEYEIDETAGTVRQVWVSEPEIGPDSCNSFAMSEARRLPVTDNILEINAMCMHVGTLGVTWDPWNRSKRSVSELPHGARIREYTRTDPAEVLFEISFEVPGGEIAWEVFGGFRTPSLYPIREES